jgi:hypothetical protein
MSRAPPAANGTIRVIGFDGQACDIAGDAHTDHGQRPQLSTDAGSRPSTHKHSPLFNRSFNAERVWRCNLFAEAGG